MYNKLLICYQKFNERFESFNNVITTSSLFSFIKHSLSYFLDIHSKHLKEFYQKFTYLRENGKQDLQQRVRNYKK